jgi:hypothetical protein
VRGAIEKAAREHNIESPPFPDGITLWEYFHGENADFWNEGSDLITPVIVLDQFEEIFNAALRDRESRQRAHDFLLEVADLAEERVPQSLKATLDKSPTEIKGYVFSQRHYKVVIVLREDYLANLEDARRRMPSLMKNRFRVEPMSGPSAMEVAWRPPIVNDKATAESIVRAVARPLLDNDTNVLNEIDDVEVDPLLLSVFCRELNEKRIAPPGQDRIDVELVEKNKRTILHEHYLRQMVGMPDPVRRFVEWKLVIRDGLRASIDWDDATNELREDSYFLETLIQRRLLTRDVRNKVTRIELTHDRLAAAIYEKRPKQAPQERRPLTRWQVLSAVAFLLVSTVAVMERHTINQRDEAIKQSRSQFDKTERDQRNRIDDLKRQLAGSQATADLNQAAADACNQFSTCRELKSEYDARRTGKPSKMPL